MRLMVRHWLCVVLLMAVVLPASAQTPAKSNAPAVEPPKAAEVQAAIRKACDWLYKEQKPNGSWEESLTRQPSPQGSGETGGQWGGVTALVTYALLASGEDAQDPRLKKAIEFLRSADLIGTYAIGMRAQVWLYLPRTEENLRAAQRDYQLLQGILQSKRGAGNYFLFDYIAGGPRIDLSASQYGVLGMWAASELMEVPTTYWKTTDEVWGKFAQKDGGWAYKGIPDLSTSPTTPSMTAAGVATLYITQDFLLREEGLNCKGNIVDPRIEAGIKFLAEAFPGLVGEKVPANRMNKPHNDDHNYYNLYGIERVGVASGLKYLGEHDWYAKGTRFLLSRQNKDGHWNHKPVITSYALIFLSRGSAPVMFNKLQYSETDRRGQPVEGPWNQRPRDVANAVRYTAKESEKTLNWQIINLDVANSRDLLDAPVLWVSGSNDLSLTDDAEAKLKDYVERGGLILGNADCRRPNFENSFRKLGTDLFPAYEWRVLPDNHPIFSEQQFKMQGRGRPVVMGLSNGVRELMLLIPRDDLGRSFQRMDLKSEVHFQLAANVFLYSIDKTHTRLKGDTYAIVTPSTAATTRTIRMARLMHGGNWNPEPAGWPRLAASLRADRKIDLKIEPMEIKDLAASGVKVAHLTGTGRLALTDEQRTALTDFVNAGGLLLVDAAGGEGEFAEQMTTELEKIVPGFAGKSETVTRDDALLKLNGKAMEKVEYRAFARTKLLGSLDAPRLRVMRIGDKPAVIMSAEDFSGALVGYQFDGILGYDPATATELVSRVLVNTAK